GLLYYGQNFLIYPSAFPQGSRQNVETPEAYDIPFENLMLDTVDRIKIHCYFMKQRKTLRGGTPFSPSETGEAETETETETEIETKTEARTKAATAYAARRPTVVMFHGNGGNMGHRVPLAHVFYKGFRCNVMMVSYRGYGHSEGSPSEKGIRIDAQTALDYLTSHPVFNSPQGDAEHVSNIIIYGQSIGGGVGLDLAARNPHAIRGIILENTFLSIPRLIPDVMPYLTSVTFLCHQRWDNAVAITKLPPTMALLMLSGSRDEIIPSWHMKELWDIAKTSGRKNATWVDFVSGHHNDTCMQRGYWEAVGDFIQRLAGGSESGSKEGLVL
ncbi:Alpha/Beta hydrolase protein, partial [Hysterangium stoloniferum]